jgi:hypothetical protein
MRPAALLGRCTGLSSGAKSCRENPMSTLKPLKLDIVSDVVCPWCYIGKRRIEDALALVPDVPVEVNWRPFFLNPWVPREGISRDEYLTAKFGSVEAYKGIAGRVVAAAGEEGLSYHPELVKRQPNTIDCHRLIHRPRCRRYQAASCHRRRRRTDLLLGAGGLRERHFRRADLRVCAEIRRVRRATGRAAGARHPPGLGRDQRAGCGVGCPAISDIP